MARKDQGSFLQEFQFVLRDGIYTTLSSFDVGSGKSAPRGYTGFRPSFAPVIPSPKKPTNTSEKPVKKPNEMSYLCYNLESAVYVYKFDGKPLFYMNFVDRKVYQSDPPLCVAASTAAMEYLQLELLIATKSGTILNFNPFSRTSVYYNEDHCIEGSKETRPTHIAWIPKNLERFAVSFTSQILLIFTTKYKLNGVPYSNPTIDTSDFAFYPSRIRKTVLKMKLRIGTDTLNHFAFSSDGTQVATASSDGFLRLFILKPIQMCGRGKSNFGGVLCVCWSPDEKFLATGTEDDLVTIWSSSTLLPLARCFGHRSWVSSVMFDSYYIPTNPDVGKADNLILPTYRERIPSPDYRFSKPPLCRLQSLARIGSICVESIPPTYRLGSVGQDGKFFIWEFSDDDLKLPVVSMSPRHVLAPSPVTQPPNGASCMNGDLNNEPNKDAIFINSVSDGEVDGAGLDSERRIKKSKEIKKVTKKGAKTPYTPSPDTQVDTQGYISPQLVNRLEPVMEKSIYEDRLTAVHFDKNFIFVSSYCGRILCWERPGKETGADAKEPIKETVDSQKKSPDS